MFNAARASALVFTAALTLAGSAAQAGVVLDQSALAATGEFGLSFGSMTLPERTGTVQTITAGKTGTLTAVDLQIWSAPGVTNQTPFSVSIYDGNYILGGATLVGSFAYPASAQPTKAFAAAGGLFNVDVSSLGYHVTSGQAFSLLLSVGNLASGSAPRWSIGTLNDADAISITFIDYAGGSAAYVTNVGGLLPVGPDRGFQTYVDVGGVPDPASWMTLVLGFGIAGAALRRRPHLHIISA